MILITVRIFSNRRKLGANFNRNTCTSAYLAISQTQDRASLLLSLHRGLRWLKQRRVRLRPLRCSRAGFGHRTGSSDELWTSGKLPFLYTEHSDIIFINRTHRSHSVIPLSASGCFVPQWLKPLSLIIFTTDWLIIPQLTLTLCPFAVFASVCPCMCMCLHKSDDHSCCLRCTRKICLSSRRNWWALWRGRKLRMKGYGCNLSMGKNNIYILFFLFFFNQNFLVKVII